MSYSVNKAIIVGNLGRDPEYKVISNGTPVCTFTVATTEKYKNQSGEQVEKSEWHNIECWRQLADICNKYLRKGQKVYIEGKIRTQSYEKDGVTRYMTRIVADDMVMLSSKDSSATGGNDYSSQSRPYAAQQSRSPQPNPYSKQQPEPAQGNSQGNYNVDMETETFDDVPF